jgi:predicted RNase H-like HicB family nuclease
MMDEHRIRFLMQRGSIAAFWDLGMKKYLIVIEATETGYSAYSPDLPGCISKGASRDQVEVNMREAIAFHLDGLREEGQPVPEPHTYSAYVELPV